MKKIYRDKIINIEGTDKFDNKFLFDYFEVENIKGVEVVSMSELLEKRKNSDMLERVKEKPAMYSNVFSPKDELEIFQELFQDAIKNNKKIHVVGVTLDAEIKILEKYYTELGFMREDINCFDVDFSKPLVTVSVNIENLMWRGSDYKAQREKIFFNPPIRESGENKAMFKGINRGVIAGINISPPPNLPLAGEEKLQPHLSCQGETRERGLKLAHTFLSNCIKEEKILSLTMGKVLCFNLEDIGFQGTKKDLVINY